MIAVFAPAVPPELARALDLAGYAWKGVASADEATDSEPADGWQGAIIDVSADPEGAWAFARLIRKTDGSSMRACCSSGAASSPTSSCATSCSTTSASRRSTRPSSRLGSAT
jgi:hypothetical protein